MKIATIAALAAVAGATSNAMTCSNWQLAAGCTADPDCLGFQCSVNDMGTDFYVSTVFHPCQAPFNWLFGLKAPAGGVSQTFKIVQTSQFKTNVLVPTTGPLGTANVFGDVSVQSLGGKLYNLGVGIKTCAVQNNVRRCAVAGNQVFFNGTIDFSAVVCPGPNPAPHPPAPRPPAPHPFPPFPPMPPGPGPAPGPNPPPTTNNPPSTNNPPPTSNNPPTTGNNPPPPTTGGTTSNNPPPAPPPTTPQPPPPAPPPTTPQPPPPAPPPTTPQPPPPAPPPTTPQPPPPAPPPTTPQPPPPAPPPTTPQPPPTSGGGGSGGGSGGGGSSGVSLGAKKPTKLRANPAGLRARKNRKVKKAI